MKKGLFAIFMSLVASGVGLANAAELSTAGGNWDEESSFEWVPVKQAHILGELYEPMFNAYKQSY